MAKPDYAMETGAGARALVWFQRFVWVGIAANIVLTLTAIFCTEWVIRFVGLEPAYPLVWPRFGAFGILLLTGFYVVAAMDPCRSRWATLFTVLCRFGGLLFFAIVGGRYIVFGLFDLLFGAPQAICLYLAWRKTRDERLHRKPGGGLLVSLMIVATLAIFAWGGAQFFLSPVLKSYAADEEFFKYGSIGNDGAAGVPYPLWVAMPQVCANHLPPGAKGYEAFGFIWEPHHDRTLGTPVGFSRAKVGVERMSINCALCHTTRARLSAGAEPAIYAGGAGNLIDIQGYQRFLSNCAIDEKFKADNLMPVMDRMVGLGWAEALLYRFVLIPVVKKQLKQQAEAYAWSYQRPRWGPGRIDPFNPVKFTMLRLSDDGTIGNSDMMPLWNLAEREKRPWVAFHWDGLSNSLRDVVVSSALGDGMVAKEHKPASMKRLENYLRNLPAPPSLHKPEGDIAKGKELFDKNCGECHAHNGARAAMIIPPAEIGTDIQRDHMWTEAAVKAYTNYRRGYDWNFTGFRKQDGYIASTLDGLWLTGPYLHNGSVPNLRALLEPPEKRPKAFLRGGDIVDGKNGGFVSPDCDPNKPPKEGFCYDTSLTGNSNAGHTYGTALSAVEKENLLAYLLTL
jgi:mono/diheme cytochrome c family protein